MVRWGASLFLEAWLCLKLAKFDVGNLGTWKKPPNLSLHAKPRPLTERSEENVLLTRKDQDTLPRTQRVLNTQDQFSSPSFHTENILLPPCVLSCQER